MKMDTFLTFKETLLIAKESKAQCERIISDCTVEIKRLENVDSTEMSKKERAHLERQIQNHRGTIMGNIYRSQGIAKDIDILIKTFIDGIK